MERIFIAFLIFVLGLFCGGGCILQRDKYWRRVWEESGKPEVKSIKELKEFIKKQKSQDS